MSPSTRARDAPINPAKEITETMNLEDIVPRCDGETRTLVVDTSNGKRYLITVVRESSSSYNVKLYKAAQDDPVKEPFLSFSGIKHQAALSGLLRSLARPEQEVFLNSMA